MQNYLQVAKTGFILAICSFCFTHHLSAQNAAAKDNPSRTSTDSVSQARTDSVRLATLKSTAYYPLIKNSEWSLVLPVDQIEEKPDLSMKYKLLMNLTQWSKDTAAIRKISAGLAEIGRIINLHVAAGIPKQNLEIVIVAHAGALNAFLKNAAYQAKFKMDNPNQDIIRQLLALPVKLLACGQAEVFTNIPRETLIPELKTALTAQVVLSNYQLKGYVLYNINDEK